MAEKFKALGNKQIAFTQFELFKRPTGVHAVTMTSEEVTAMCPVTGQPDWYKVDVHYQPSHFCIESKTMKLYLQSFRTQGLFCEAFADRIARDVMRACHARSVTVRVQQKPRGGVAIIAEATLLGEIK